MTTMGTRWGFFSPLAFEEDEGGGLAAVGKARGLEEAVGWLEGMAGDWGGCWGDGTGFWVLEAASGTFRLPLFSSFTGNGNGAGRDGRPCCSCPLPPVVEAFEICSDSLEEECSSEVDSGAGSSPNWWYAGLNTGGGGFVTLDG